MTTFSISSHDSLPELAIKVRSLWDEHDSLDEEVLTLRTKEQAIEQRMQEITAEVLLIRNHMKQLTPSSFKECSVMLNLIREEIYSLTLWEGTDIEALTSIMTMVQSVQAVFDKHVV